MVVVSSTLAVGPIANTLDANSNRSVHPAKHLSKRFLGLLMISRGGLKRRGLSGQGNGGHGMLGAA